MKAKLLLKNNVSSMYHEFYNKNKIKDIVWEIERIDEKTNSLFCRPAEFENGYTAVLTLDCYIINYNYDLPDDLFKI